jgi:hypothetical protein
MKLKLGKIQTEASADFDSAEFDIGNKAVIMDILRGRMYSNPIWAICREIMCNARDAHREVKQGNKAIHVIFPTSLEPTFIIRDFGPGITPERMREIFVMYGNSTKRSTNRFTGGFGLGSKTPFAYSDTFTVTTITPFDGGLMKRTYVAYIDDTRLGTMSLVEEGITDEPQGTSIIVTVKDGDHHEFMKYVEKTAEYWRIKPKIINDEIEWPKHEVLHKGEGWEYHNTGRYHHSGTPKAIVDGIPYDIDIENVFKDGTHREWGNLSIRLKFKTGEVDLTANREKIDYSKKSVKKLAERILQIQEVMADKVGQGMRDAATLREAMVAWDKVPQRLQSLVSPLWQNLDVRNAVINFNGKGGYVKITEYKLIGDDIKRHTYPDWQRKIRLTKNDRIVENDVPTRGTIGSRLRRFLTENSTVQSVDVVTFVEKDVGGTVTFPAREEAAKSKYWDHMEIVKLSALPLPSRATGPAQVSRPARLKKLVPTHVERGAKWTWAKHPDDKDQFENGRGLYVVLKGKNALLDDTDCPNTLTPDNMHRLSKLIKRPIFAIFKAFARKIGPGWKRVTTELIEKKIEAFKKTRAIRAHLEFGDADGINWICNDKFREMLDDPTSPAHRYSYYAQHRTSFRDVFERFAMLCRIVGQSPPKVQSPLEDEFEERYPLIKTLDDEAYHIRLPIEEAVLYVKAKDASIREQTDTNKGEPECST